jgi:hypothetical protein
MVKQAHIHTAQQAENTGQEKAEEEEGSKNTRHGRARYR